jgi:hypothetical protein
VTVPTMRDVERLQRHSRRIEKIFSGVHNGPLSLVFSVDGAGQTVNSIQHLTPEFA